MRFSDISSNWEDDEWVWCLRCERVYSNVDWESNRLRCPTKGCNGNLADAHPGRDIREANPGYPEIPESGAYYALYGKR